MTDGEFANQSLCYDCCADLVAENVKDLKKRKGKIIALFVATLIGFGIGFALGVSEGSGWLGLFLGLWFGSFWNWVKSSIGGWWNNPAGRTVAGFVGACIGGLLVAPVITVVKIVRCIIYLIRTSKFIKEDSEALVQMKDYMEYTQVLSENRGISIEELMQRSDMSGNAYAQMVSEHGEAAAEDMMRKCTMTIAANGEIIRKFEA